MPTKMGTPSSRRSTRTCLAQIQHYMVGRGSIALLHPTISSLGLQGPRRKYRMVTQFSFGFNLAKTNYGHTSPRALMKLFLVSTVLYFTPHCDDAV
ncbi:hypothetical protein MUK42_08817 [Musa troglodytarum]|uniref:Uncharacterized protein n=1 Tax=Musa troglodytarum TaxID=320322 RepID=A0A9E7JET2_9LILI|nr:hypothetical protein MUK42_08817 [Musa troglodytarum]